MVFVVLNVVEYYYFDLHPTGIAIVASERRVMDTIVSESARLVEGMSASSLK